MFYIILARIGAPPWGAFRPNVWRSNPAQPSWISHRNLLDFDVDFGSFGCRSWVPLGSHFRSSWRLFRSKVGQKPSSNRLRFEKVILHEISRFPILLVFFASTWRPKTTQDRSKTGPRSSWIDVLSSSIIASIFDRFGIVLGSNLGAIWWTTFQQNCICSWKMASRNNPAIKRDLYSIFVQFGWPRDLVFWVLARTPNGSDELGLNPNMHWSTRTANTLGRLWTLIRSGMWKRVESRWWSKENVLPCWDAIRAILADILGRAAAKRCFCDLFPGVNW